MKRSLFVVVIGFFLILFASSLSVSQPAQFDFAGGGVTMTLPEGWVAREHILLLLMPKAEDLTIEAEVLATQDLSEAVQLSEFELKSVFPQDTAFVVEDIVVNKMPVKKIDKVSGGEQLFYYLLKTPEDKIISLKCKSEKGIVLRHKGEILKLLQSIKPKQ